MKFLLDSFLNNSPFDDEEEDGLAADRADNRRTIDAMLGYSVNGDVPRFVADAASSGGLGHASARDFMRQLNEKDSERAVGFFGEVLGRMTKPQQDAWLGSAVKSRPENRKAESGSWGEKLKTPYIDEVARRDINSDADWPTEPERSLKFFTDIQRRKKEQEEKSG